MRHLRAQEWRRAAQCRKQRIDVTTAKPRHERNRMLQVRANPHLGYGDAGIRQVRIAKIMPLE